MRSTTSAAPRYPADTTSELDQRRSSTGPAGVSLPQLYFLRLGYLLMAVGLAVTKWPLIINHDRPWPLMEGVETCMLVALPLWISDQMDPATLSVFYSCLLVLIVAAVIPWRYVVAHYVTKHGDPWRTAPRDVEIPQ